MIFMVSSVISVAVTFCGGVDGIADAITACSTSCCGDELMHSLSYTWAGTHVTTDVTDICIHCVRVSTLRGNTCTVHLYQMTGTDIYDTVDKEGEVRNLGCVRDTKSSRGV
jgi:hypothetical protein